MKQNAADNQRVCRNSLLLKHRFDLLGWWNTILNDENANACLRKRNLFFFPNKVGETRFISLVYILSSKWYFLWFLWESLQAYIRLHYPFLKSLRVHGRYCKLADVRWKRYSSAIELLCVLILRTLSSSLTVINYLTNMCEGRGNGVSSNGWYMILAC